MQFEYEITVEDYIASQLLYWKLSGHKRRRNVLWILAGTLSIFVAWHEQRPGWCPALLASIGLWWIYAGIAALFPNHYLRRSYRELDFSGRKFQANVSETGLEVTSDLWSCSAKWAAVLSKAENSDVFILYAAGTLFMFGRKYLSEHQQREFRRLAALTTSD